MTSSPSTLDTTRPYKVSYLLDLPIASLTYDQVLSHLERCIAQKQKTFCVTINLDILRLAYQRPEVYKVIKSANFIFADGMPLVALSKFKTKETEQTTPVPERVAGCDIVQDLCQLSHEKGYTIFMLGAAEGVADQAKAILEAKLPNVKVVGTYSPAPDELKTPEKNAAIIDKINQSGADILFVALGAPKQETWISDNLAQLNPYVMIPCGASIDFIAGVQKKSPKWLGKIGLEWVFRMACDPGRLFDRYILKDLPFLIQAFPRI